MTCPHCYSQFITLIQFDFGQDKTTGYHDQGELFECRECGKVSTPEEVEEADILAFDQAMRAGCILARTADLISLQLTLRMQERAGLELADMYLLAREECREQGRLDWMVN